MIERLLLQPLITLLSQHAAVGLLGPRQVGKTTLALAIAATRSAVYLDLEAPSDLAKLAEPELYLTMQEDKLVILDEIQRVPGLFQTLRGLIDHGRQRGHRNGRFLVLGSASLDLLRQSAENLAGRIVYVELGPFQLLEVGGPPGVSDRLWLRGGFPDSFLAESESASLEWRQAFIRTYLERDIPQLGPRLPAETLHRFWTMLAHLQGEPLNAARLATGLGISGQTVGRYLDLLVDLLLVRRLSPWVANIGKRLVRSPKIYVRDSGLVHALLGIPDLDTLLGHPVIGSSWEGFAIEMLIAAAPRGTEAYYYRTAAGAEIDLLLALPGNRLWAIEIKRSLMPKPAKGFHQACIDLNPAARYVVFPGAERFPVSPQVEAIGLYELAAILHAS
ncbi:MAG: ATP-binding protein [Candidatus Competibacteraceae bacterium]